MKFSQIPLTESRGGVAFPEMLVLPPTSRIAAYVYSGGVRSEDTTYIRNNTVQKLSEAIDRVRSGAGDTIIVRRGHSEEVVDATMFQYIEPGTVIIGEGDPMQSNAPTFRWTTAATANWTLDQDDITIANLFLRMEGFDGVTSGITVTGEGCRIVGNRIKVAYATDYHCLTAIKVDAGGDLCTISDNYFYGNADDITQAILIDDALQAIPTGTIITRNTFFVSGATGTSCITLACAATGLLFDSNIMYNLKAASTTTIAIEDSASDGIICNNFSAILADGVAASTGIVFAGSPCDSTIKCFNNYTSDEAMASGVLSPAACTT